MLSTSHEKIGLLICQNKNHEILAYSYSLANVSLHNLWWNIVYTICVFATYPLCAKNNSHVRCILSLSDMGNNLLSFSLEVIGTLLLQHHYNSSLTLIHVRWEYISILESSIWDNVLYENPRGLTTRDENGRIQAWINGWPPQTRYTTLFNNFRRNMG